MTHIWLRAEARATERRTPLLPDGAAQLIRDGARITVERSTTRVISDAAYSDAGCDLADTGSWPDAPRDAIILGLKELPDSDAPLTHRHIFFAHAYKGQPGAIPVLTRFADGGGTLLDLEYLVDGTGRRVAAFGYWAGYVGAAVSLLVYAAQKRGTSLDALNPWADSATMREDVAGALGSDMPAALIIGAKGRVGMGAADLFGALNISPTRWDMEETRSGGPFPEVARHEILVNAVLAMPGVPVFAGPDILATDRALRVIGDVACDPGTPYNPIPLYGDVTSWDAPALRVHGEPPLDIMAIDNLPSLLPREASEEFATALLPHLAALGTDDGGVWARAEETFRAHLSENGLTTSG
ncbi:saccharopine dehydrogenase [Pelagovum pacificum]|uniref:Saccharopine dehydrogenase [NAD(+), L-lysine-forming] n=1 Tax=Pelagovum pacificum TaxID=2588711 RepID=A0A5C5GHK7_9RHOB|nr:saccharopine dehydrogenase [Pelagovum pacificum]QQA43144.1 saccharopine dehydrogenase [Pelagovum pacificum]TNY33714.1 saccharopine dehydrogenase [Pelagovum pacificum]